MGVDRFPAFTFQDQPGDAPPGTIANVHSGYQVLPDTPTYQDAAGHGTRQRFNDSMVTHAPGCVQ